MSQPTVLFTNRNATDRDSKLIDRSKVEIEEMQHTLSTMPSTLSAAPVKFEKARRGNTVAEWAWKGDSIVIHLLWTIPPILNKRAMCKKIVNLLYDKVPHDLHVDIKAPFHEIEGGAYTIILHGMKLKPGAETYFRDKVFPLILGFDPTRHSPKGPLK